jgi:hypothetical protein
MLRIGLASHGLNEDLFERRLDQFEAIDGRCGRGLVQQLLRVAVFGLSLISAWPEKFFASAISSLFRNAALPSNSTITRLRS